MDEYKFYSNTFTIQVHSRLHHTFIIVYVVIIIYSARSLVIVVSINCRYLSLVISPGSLCIRYVKITITNDN